MRIFFSAGEASGDAYGAALLVAIRKLVDVEAEALGGRQLLAAGAVLAADSTAWGAIGIAESLRVYPKARLGLANAKRALRTGVPGLFVPIDYGYLNIGLARYAKEHGWKVVYFSPPGAWRKNKQGADLPNVTDAVITPFSWSAEILNRMGAKAYWFGHPIKEMMKSAGDPHPLTPSPFSGEKGEGGFRLAILPGSRRSEVDLLLPVFAAALQGFAVPVEFAIASSLNLEEVRSKWAKFAPGRRSDVFTPGDTYGVLRRARAAIVCSGTATLEAALCRCPHLVVYKVSKLVELQARLIRFKVRHISQPNILLEREVVRELIQHAATPAAIRSEVDRLLTDDAARDGQIAAFAELDALLGPDDAITQSARVLADFLSP